MDVDGAAEAEFKQFEDGTEVDPLLDSIHAQLNEDYTDYCNPQTHLDFLLSF